MTIAVDKRNNRVRGLTIIDRLTGSGQHTVESFIHFHPTISLEVSIVGEIKIIRNRMEIGSIIIPDDQEYQIDAAVYCPEFGLRQPNQVVALREHSDLPLTLQYEIRRSRC